MIKAWEQMREFVRYSTPPAVIADVVFGEGIRSSPTSDYQVPFRFNGKLDLLTLTIDRPKLSPEDV